MREERVVAGIDPPFEWLTRFKPKFDRLDRDADRVWDIILAELEAGRISTPKGRSPYSVYAASLHGWLLELYFSRGLHDAIEAHHTPSGEKGVSSLHQSTKDVAQRFVDLGEPQRAWRLWRTHLSLVKDAYWQMIAHRDRGFTHSKFLGESEPKQRASFQKFVARTADDKARLLNVCAEARKFFVRNGAGPREIDRIDRDIADIKAEKRTIMAGKPDPRAMNEELFWEILEGDKTGGVAERLETLPERLAAFTPKAIKEFGVLLREKFDAAYRTDVWALAYLLRGGCSDDSFMEFRAWLILLGRRIYEEAVADPDSFDVGRFDGSGTASLSLLDAPAVAYELRAGKSLPHSRRRAGALKGPKVDEADFAALLPRVATAVSDR